MTLSTDTVLERLDEWEYNRAKRNYTAQFASKLKSDIERAMKNRPELSNLVDKTTNFFSLENYLKKSESSWRDDYALTISLYEGKPTLGIDIERLNKNTREKYLEPLMNHQLKLRSFVDKVEDSYIKNRGKITDTEIDGIFLDTFNGFEGFKDYIRENMRLVPIFLYGISQNLDKDILKRRLEYQKIFARVSISAIEKVYSDIDGGQIDK